MIAEREKAAAEAAEQEGCAIEERVDDIAEIDGRESAEGVGDQLMECDSDAVALDLSKLFDSNNDDSDSSDDEWWLED